MIRRKHKCTCYICKNEYESDTPMYNVTQSFCSKECQELFNEQYSDTKQCLNCGKEFHIANQNIKFCSYQCKYEYSIKVRPEREYICDNCGKTFTTFIKKRNDKKFCSWECYQEYDNKRNAKEIAICEQCGKTFTKQYHSQRLCSWECQHAWQSEHTPKIQMPRKETSIEIIVRDILDNENIQSQYNAKFSYYEIDLFLEQYNLGIEIMGEYWHADPRLFPSISPMQKNNIIRDKRKHTYIINNYNYQILYLWESDIKNQQNLITQLIHNYINNKGHLPDYNSFNYILKNGETSLIEKRIVPYIEWETEKLPINSLND